MGNLFDWVKDHTIGGDVVEYVNDQTWSGDICWHRA